jgi:hypothetical protein
MSLPSEKLQDGWGWKMWTGLSAGAALVVGLGITAVITGPLASAAPEPTPTYVVPHAASCDTYRGGVCYTPDMQAAADKQEQQIADAQAAAEAAAQKAAAEKAAQQAAQRAAQQKTADTGSGLLPAGAPVPSIPGTTSPDTSKCASGTASDVNGVPTCQ